MTATSPISALNHALSGLGAINAKTTAAATNLEHSQDANFSRQGVNLATSTAGCIKVTSEYRITDQKQYNLLLQDLSSLNKLEVQDTYLTRLQTQIGRNGHEGSLGDAISKYKTALRISTESPNKPGALQDVVVCGANLAQALSKFSTIVQTLREQADQDLNSAVTDAQNKIDQISSLNASITLVNGQKNGVQNIQDQQDAARQELAKYLNFTTLPTDTNTYNTAAPGPNPIGISLNGRSLLPPGNALSYIPSGAMSAATAYNPPPAVSQINPIQLGNADITNEVSGGKIAGLVELRDKILPNIQKELDSLAATLRDQMNAVHNQGTSIPGLNQLIGNRIFTTPAAANSFAGTGTVRIAVVDANNNFVANADVDLSTVTTVSDLVTSINTVLGASGTAAINAAGNLTLTATDPLHTIGIVSASNPPATVTTGGLNLGFSHYFGLNDFFTTGSKIVGDLAIEGVSSDFKVRSDILAQPMYFSRGAISTAAAPAVGSAAIGDLDSTIISKLITALDSSQTFQATGNLPMLKVTLNEYAGLLAGDIDVKQKNIKSLYEQDQDRYDINQKSYRNMVGVNSKETLSDIMMLQQQHAMLSQVMKTILQMTRELTGVLK